MGKFSREVNGWRCISSPGWPSLALVSKKFLELALDAYFGNNHFVVGDSTGEGFNKQLMELETWTMCYQARNAESRAQQELVAMS